jgi:LAO/AO transport system kinase
LSRPPSLDDILNGVPAAVGRAISLAERDVWGNRELLAAIHQHTGRAHVIGVTGIPGGGKSTLVQRLALEFRRRDLTVGIVAIDPSSPYSGGSILGDRIRMGESASDPGVFIRSMATHGASGGLARAAMDAVSVLDAAGKDIVIIETVGVGQDEVDVAAGSHTTVVVSVPGTGDDIQAIKAGILEIADIHVVNKSDLPGSRHLMAQLRDMLRMGSSRNSGWEVRLVACSAKDDEGIGALCDLLREHREWLEASGALQAREKDMAAGRLNALVHALVSRRIAAPDVDIVERMVTDVAERRTDPRTAAETVVGAL